MKTLYPILIVITAAIAAHGCAPSSSRPVELPTAPTGTAIAQADGYVVNADALSERAKPYARPEGRVLLDAAHESHGAARERLTAAAKANAAAAKQVLSLTADRDAWKGKYDKLHGSIGATLERWVRRFLIAIVVGWVVLGTAGTLLTALLPAGGSAFLIGRELLGLLPFANLFTNLSRWIGNARTAAAAAGAATTTTVTVTH